MDYIDGISIGDPDRLRAEGYDLEKIGGQIVEDYSTQVLDDGFFHADPHAGNIILKDGVIYFIDLGMVGRMSSHDRGIVKDMIFAVAEGDVPKLKDSLMRFAVTRGDSASLDHTAFLSDLDFIVADFAGLDLKDLDIGEFLTSLVSLARKNNVELPSVVTMFARGMVTLEGLLTEYMPNVNMVQIISAHIKNEKSSYRRMQETAQDLAHDAYRAAKGQLEAAEYLGLASRMLTRGQLKSTRKCWAPRLSCAILAASSTACPWLSLSLAYLSVRRWSTLQKSSRWFLVFRSLALSAIFRH